MCVPFAIASSPINAPTSDSSSVSQVAPSAVAQGKHAAGIPLKKRVPRTPFGPSDMRSAGMFRRGTDSVCQKSWPSGMRLVFWALYVW